jgi:two-component sensor histidine kinase
MFFIGFCLSQNDSIQNLIDNSKTKDSLYVSRLIALSNTYKTGNSNQQIALLKEAKTIATKNKDSLSLGIIFQKIAGAYNSKGVYDKAIAAALNAKHIFDKQDVLPQQLSSNSRLITIYRNNGYAQKAINLSKENLGLIKDLPLNKNTGRYYFDLGVSYSANNQLDSALVYYQKATYLAKEAKFLTGEMFMILSTGQLYKKMNRFDEAKNAFNTVLEYYEKVGNRNGTANVNYSLATLESLQSRHKASIPYYKTSLKLYEEMNRLQFVKDINQKLYIAYSIVQDTAKANKALKVYNIMKDTLNNREQRSLIADMTTKYETEKIRAENKLNAKQAELAKAESERNSIYFWITLIGLAMAIIIGLLYYSRLKQEKNNELIQQELKASQKQLALEKQYRDSELKALKAQMNPHFIFNVLNSIQEFIVLNQKEKASEYLATFAELIRNYLNFSNEDFISLREEVDTISNYLQLEHLRFGEDFQYSISVAKNIDKDHVKLPAMFIQPYVENALKHGLFNKDGLQKLDICFSKTSENTLFCSIEDNGIGRIASENLKKQDRYSHKSFATSANQNRLELLRQRHKKDIGVKIIDINNTYTTGTRVELTIPILQN